MLKTININLLNDLAKNSNNFSNEFLTKEEKRSLLIICIVSCFIFLATFGGWSYLKFKTEKFNKEYEELNAEYSALKPKLEKIKAQSDGLKEKREILKFKLLAKQEVETGLMSWFGVLNDISNIVPKEIKIKEIAKIESRSRRASANNLNIKGQITAEKAEPLKYISFFNININSNLPKSSKLHNATIKEVSYNEFEEYYEFDISTEIKKEKTDKKEGNL